MEIYQPTEYGEYDEVATAEYSPEFSPEWDFDREVHYEQNSTEYRDDEFDSGGSIRTEGYYDRDTGQILIQGQELWVDPSDPGLGERIREKFEQGYEGVVEEKEFTLADGSICLARFEISGDSLYIDSEVIVEAETIEEDVLDAEYLDDGGGEEQAENLNLFELNEPNESEEQSQGLFGMNAAESETAAASFSWFNETENEALPEQGFDLGSFFGISAESSARAENTAPETEYVVPTEQGTDTALSATETDSAKPEKFNEPSPLFALGEIFDYSPVKETAEVAEVEAEQDTDEESAGETISEPTPPAGVETNWEANEEVTDGTVTELRLEVAAKPEDHTEESSLPLEKVAELAVEGDESFIDEVETEGAKHEVPESPAALPQEVNSEQIDIEEAEEASPTEQQDVASSEAEPAYALEKEEVAAKEQVLEIEQDVIENQEADIQTERNLQIEPIEAAQPAEVSMEDEEETYENFAVEETEPSTQSNVKGAGIVLKVAPERTAVASTSQKHNHEVATNFPDPKVDTETTPVQNVVESPISLKRMEIEKDEQIQNEDFFIEDELRAAEESNQAPNHSEDDLVQKVPEISVNSAPEANFSTEELVAESIFAEVEDVNTTEVPHGGGIAEVEISNAAEEETQAETDSTQVTREQLKESIELKSPIVLEDIKSTLDEIETSSIKDTAAQSKVVELKELAKEVEEVAAAIEDTGPERAEQPDPEAAVSKQAEVLEVAAAQIKEVRTEVAKPEQRKILAERPAIRLVPRSRTLAGAAKKRNELQRPAKPKSQEEQYQVRRQIRQVVYRGPRLENINGIRLRSRVSTVGAEERDRLMAANRIARIPNNKVRRRLPSQSAIRMAA